MDRVHFTDSWAVHIENGDHEVASDIAEKHGFVNYGQIGSLPGYYHFVHKKVNSKRRRRRDLENKTFTLLSEEKIKWAEQQHVLEREKRSVIPDYIQTVHSISYSIQDPMYNDQWYLNNVGQSSGPPGLDINVFPVWSRGISGKGVVVSILDDGLDHTHPDLKKNYDARASYDFNDYDEDPMPKTSDLSNCHGTKCAGEVAAEAGNNICGVGVAFNSSIGGVRMLDGNVTDTIEGSALSFKKDFIDIYSCAWGPKDDGKRFGRPGTLAGKALELGAKEGRQGRGSIFVWATGNGGLTDDDCNCDGYTTSVYTISIGAISDHGLSTYYTESCASTLAVTYSGGSHREKKENKIVTTTLNHKCTDEFKGTSSAAPLAAGMIALMLEANKNLTWRDVQTIIVETSLMTSPLDEGWRRNGAGKWFNQKFGFGRMDASAMVEKAVGWSNVGNLRTCWSDKSAGPWSIPSAGTVLVAMNSTACSETNSEVKSVEHVQVVVSMKHRHRGHVSMELISPSGTRTQLLKTRRNDNSNKGLKDWIFMSVHFWGEDPRGLWTLAVTDNSNNNREHHREKSKFGDLEDATEAYQDEVDGKDKPNDTTLDIEHEDIVDQEDLFTSSEEFENNIFKDDTYKKSKNGTLKVKGKLREKNDKMNGKLNKTNKMKHAKKVKKVQSEDEKEADKLVDEILSSEKTKNLSTNLEEFVDKNSENNTNSTVKNNNNNDYNITTKAVDLPSLNKTSNKTDDNENTMLEGLLKTVLSEVFTNFRSTDDSNIENRIKNLEDVLFKTKSKPVNDSVSSIILKALNDGNAADKIDHVLTVLENTKNLSKYQNTSFSKNAGVVSDVLKVLKDILSTKNDDRRTKGYKQRITKLLETSSNGTRKLREKLFNDLESTSSGKEISPQVVSDALTLIGHIIRHTKKHKKSKKLKSLPKDIRILLKGANGKFVFPLQGFTPRTGSVKKEVTTTKTSSSKEIHHNGNNVETITVEHVKVQGQPTRQDDVTKKLNIIKHEDNRKFYVADNDRDHYDHDRNGLDHFQLHKPEDESGFTIAIMKNGKTIEERRVDNAQARDYLARGASYSHENNNDIKKYVPHGISEDEHGHNIDVEVMMDKDREGNSNTRNKIDSADDDKTATKDIEFDVIRPISPLSDSDIQDPHNVTMHLTNPEIDENLIRKMIKTNIETEKKVKKPKKINKKKLKKHKNLHKDVDDEEGVFELRNAFPFLQFADPSQMPQIPMQHGEDSENYIQQLYNPFNPKGLPDFEDLPDFQEHASFYDYPSMFENEPKLVVNEKRSVISTHHSNEQNNPTQESIEHRSKRHRRSILTESDTDENLNREKRTTIVDDVIDEGDGDEHDDEGPHVVKRSAIFNELYPSKTPFISKNENKISTQGQKNKKTLINVPAEKRSAIQKALSLEGNLKQKLLSMRKESSSVLDIMKRVHDDIAIGDSSDLRNLEKQLATLGTKININNIENINNNKDNTNSLVRTKVLKKPTVPRAGKYDIKDPDEYYKYGVDSSGELLQWTIKFYGTGS